MASPQRISVCYLLKMKKILFFLSLAAVPIFPCQGEESPAHKENLSEFIYGRGLAGQCSHGRYGTKEYGNCIVRHLWHCNGLLSGGCAPSVPHSRLQGAYFEEFEEAYLRGVSKMPNDDLDLEIYKFFFGSYSLFCKYYNV